MVFGNSLLRGIFLYNEENVGGRTKLRNRELQKEGMGNNIASIGK
jgi:hypothetical protein